MAATAVSTMDLDTLLASLGPNKITIPIHRNDACELHVYKNENASLKATGFEDMEDLLQLYRSSSGVRGTKPQNSPMKPTGKAYNTAASDPLLHSIATQVDPSISLFSGQELYKKLDQFRRMLSDNLDNYHDAYKKIGFKKHKLSLEDVKDSIMNPKRTSHQGLLLYAANLLKCNILVEETSETFEYANDRYLILRRTSFGEYECELHETGFSLVKKAETTAMEVDPKKLNGMLVKELRELAQKLHLSISKTGEDGKKKNLLKDELITEISQHLASLK